MQRDRLDTEVMLAQKIYETCPQAQRVKVAQTADNDQMFEVQVYLGSREVGLDDVQFELPEYWTTSDFVDETAEIDEDNVLHFYVYWYALREEETDFQVTDSGVVVQ